MISSIKNNLFTLLTANIILMYAVGLIGITTNYELGKLFILSLTPLNLIVNIAMLLYFHKDWNRNFIISAIVIAIAGFAIEVIGVKTGAVFGNYFYGKSLGFKILEVPV